MSEFLKVIMFWARGAYQHLAAIIIALLVVATPKKCSAFAINYTFREWYSWLGFVCGHPYYQNSLF